MPIAAFASTKRHSVSADRCSSIVSPSTLSFPAAGGHATLNVTVTGGCAWSPVASDSWISAAPSGSQVSVDVSANTATTARSGLIHVRGAVVVITQDAAAAPTNPNLLSNGGFESGTAGWSDVFSGAGSFSVGSNSPVASPLPSGNAVRLESDAAPPSAGYQLSQCVAVTGGKRYELGARVLIPSGQSSGSINVAAFEYWVPGCPSTTAAYHGRQILVANQPIGAWFDENVVWNTDFNTKSILVVIGVGGSFSPPFSAWFDDVYIREKP